MRPTSRPRTVPLSRRGWFALVTALAFVILTASSALAWVDEFGGASFSAPYAPYTAGPVMHEADVAPYAPYVAGPVIHTVEPLPYDTSSRAYAPYTAGPVMHEADLAAARTPYNIGHYLLK